MKLNLIALSILLLVTLSTTPEAALKPGHVLMSKSHGVIQGDFPTMKNAVRKMAQNRNTRAELQKNLPQCFLYGQIGVDLTSFDITAMDGNCTFNFDHYYNKFWKATGEQQKWVYSLGMKSANKHEVRIRKEMRHISRDEFIRLIRAFWVLKTTEIDGLSKYDIFRMLHSYEQALANHRSVSLFMWHREFIFRFENALREVDSDIVLPYWSTTLDAPLSYPQYAVTWSADFLGTSNGFVTDGPLSYWPIVSDVCKSYTDLEPLLKRYYTDNKTNYLVDKDDVASLLAYDSYEELIQKYYSCFFLRHGTVHLSLAGVFGISPRFVCSFEEPAFPFWHGYVDLLYEAFRMTQRFNPETDYPRASIPQYSLEWCKEYDSIMYPFLEMKIYEAMSLNYSKMIQFRLQPHACLVNADCDSEFLWCDISMTSNSTVFTGVCTSKIRHGGRCDNEPNQACITNACINSKCV